MMAITEVVIVFVIGLHFMVDKSYFMIDLRSRHSTEDGVTLTGAFRQCERRVGWGRFGMEEPCERQSLESR